jgi:hypothetical protein
MHHLENIRERFLTENPNLSPEEKKKINLIFKEIKDFSGSYFKETKSIFEFRQKSLEIQNHVAMNYSNVKIPKPNSCLIVSTLNSYEEKPEMQPLVRNLYDDNNNITEFCQRSDNIASRHVKSLVERNQFSEDIHNPKDVQELMTSGGLNNTNFGENSKDQYLLLMT